MEDKQARRGRWVTRTLGAVATGLIILLLLFVLSIGPAEWLVDRGYISQQSFEAVYGHLIEFAGSTGTLGLLYRYAELWRNND